MKTVVPKERLKLYLWMALAYILLWSLHDLTSTPATFFPRLINHFWRGCYVIVLNYLFFEYTVPFVLQKRRSLFYNLLVAIPLGWIHLLLWSYGLYAWRLLGIALQVYTPILSFPSTESAVTAQMAFSAGSVFFFGIIRHGYLYVKLQQVAQQLRIEKQEAELNYLKSQTNPHFLFNTLNNIYSLARDKSDLAPESILRLSKILRFLLYEASGEYIAVEQELKIMSDYIDLERLRYDESLHINFNYDIEDQKQALPPLLLMPLVENAFKHGVSETRGRPFMDIHLSIKRRQLKFVVKNSTGTPPDERPIKENIGLSNLRRQLELLYKDYTLSVQHGNDVFTAVLTINLASHV